GVNRNDSLNKASFALHQLVAAGALDAGVVERELMAAATAVGLGEAEARKTINSGRQAGLKEPRAMPNGTTAGKTVNGAPVPPPPAPEPWEPPIPLTGLPIVPPVPTHAFPT